jgi:GTP-binding protein YchF
MGLSVGIVGLPNAGKSTLFNAMTKAGAVVGNYPFTTIEPNTGIVPMPDVRLGELAAIFNPPKVIPATVTFTDIAGLVRGASKGEGLGNQFLGHIRECDAIAMVTRDFADADVTHVEGSVDPLRDLDVIELELILADVETVTKRLEKTEKTARVQKEKAEELIALLQKLLAHLNDAKPARTLSLTPEQQELARDLWLLTIKPMIVIANVDESKAADEPSKALVDRAKQSGADALAVSARIESEISELPAEDQKEFLSSLNLTEPGLHRVAKHAYSLLRLVTFLTAGEKEVRAWTVREGDTALDAAATIHTDFAKGFIRAEVTAAEDLIALGSDIAVREAGKQRLEGKDYLVRDGDVMHFRFNV